MAKTLMVSTCGTSLLNAAASDDQRQAILRLANAAGADIRADDRGLIDNAGWAAEGKLLRENSPLTEKCKMSAELSSMLLYYGGQFPTDAENARSQHHILISTDTYVGRAAADAIGKFLRNTGMAAEVLPIDRLRTNSFADFQYGLDGIIAWCARTIPGYRQEGFKVVFNLSGGFKSVLGWMQTLGVIYADECIYTFERTDELLRIPRLPLRSADFSEDVRAFVANHVDFFAPLAERGGKRPADELPAGAPEILFRPVGGDVELSSMGRLIWEQVRRTHYQ
ncbi:MAG: hypothetical protein ACP5I8_08575 [Phycisphaerae bacterium]